MHRVLTLLLLLLAAGPAEAKVATFLDLRIEEEQGDLRMVPGTETVAIYHLTNLDTTPLFLVLTTATLYHWTPPNASADDRTLFQVPRTLVAPSFEVSPSAVEIPSNQSATVRLSVRLPAEVEVGSEHRVILLAGGPAQRQAIAELTVVAIQGGARGAALEWARQNPGGIASAAVALVAVGGAALLQRRDPWRFPAALPLVGLYTRLTRAKVLDHGTRGRIHDLVLADPGIRFSELKRDLGLNTGVLVHHLRTLEQHQLVASRREGTQRRFYPVGVRLPEPQADPLTPMQQRILDALGGEGLTRKAVAEHFGLTQQGANHHLKTLERKGVIEVRYVGGEWRCYPASLPAGDPGSPAPP